MSHTCAVDGCGSIGLKSWGERHLWFKGSNVLEQCFGHPHKLLAWSEIQVKFRIHCWLSGAKILEP